MIVEILSPGNERETWINGWAYTTIPSVQEILIIRSTEIGAEILLRDINGTWPERPITIKDGLLELQSIGLSVDLAGIYRDTRLAKP